MRSLIAACNCGRLPASSLLLACDLTWRRLQLHLSFLQNHYLITFSAIYGGVENHTQ